MTRFLYSPYIKTVLVILFTLCLVFGALFTMDTLWALNDEDMIIYEFEEKFSDSRHLASITFDPEMILCSAFHNFFYTDDDNGEEATVDGMNFEDYLNTSLQNMYYADKLNYYISVNGTVFTNCDAKSAEDLSDTDFYRHTTMSDHGTITKAANPSGHFDYYAMEEIAEYAPTAEIEVITVITDDYAEECEVIWSRQEKLVKDAIRGSIGFFIAAIFLLLLLTFSAGRKKNGDLRESLLDRIWTEIHLTVVCGVLIGVPALIFLLLDAYFNGQIALYLAKYAAAALTILGSLVFLMSFLSLVRMIKCRTFLERSIVFIVLRWVWRGLKDIVTGSFLYGKKFKKIMEQTLSKRSGKILLAALFLYTALIGLFGVMIPTFGFLPLLLGVLLFCAAAYILAHRAKDLDEIKKGAHDIRRGRVYYHIPEIQSSDLKGLASDINCIAEGMEHSMEGRLRAERMKTELITNISHDLKTPLTSIINYTTLLSNVEGLPEEATDYIKVIAKKSEGLKNLTQDLFTISKVQSGNETFEREKLDAAELIEQAMGEHDSEIKNSGLTFCVKTEKDLCFFADGRKMSRVMGNLIDNALRYAMKNTRVFLEAHEDNGYVTIEIKNTSAEAMEFDAEEITARFVRGDASRTDGGNGLGLAIAKSYTEGCGGMFTIVIDGDLFKAILTFPKI